MCSVNILSRHFIKINCTSRMQQPDVAYVFFRYSRASNIEATSDPGRLHCVPYISGTTQSVRIWSSDTNIL